MIRIAIVDDQQIIRESLERVLSFFSDIEVLFLAEDGTEAVKRIATTTEHPHVLLMDLSMPVLDGVEATRQIKEIAPGIHILILTISEAETHILQAIQAGADGYLLKDEEPRRIYQAILDATQGRMPLSPQIARKTMEMIRKTAALSSMQPADYGLTKREIQLLQLLISGKSYTAMAEELSISPHTVRRHTERIYQKLSIHSRAEAGYLVAQNQWFT
ncbi:MAG: response regulator transcription factor [Bacteroidetes bacterium]|nr:response regulator transcription factor [Bacteroidota bacterium]